MTISMGGNFLFGALNAVKGGRSNTVSVGGYRHDWGDGRGYQTYGSYDAYVKAAAQHGFSMTFSGGRINMTKVGGSSGASANDPTSQAAAIAKENALKAADIQANLVLKQAQAQQTALRMQNDTLQQDFYNVDRAAIAGLDRLKNRGFDALGDAAGQAAALGISMSGTALDNQQYLNTQVMNSFTDYNSQMRTQKNQIQGQIDQNKFAIQTSQASAAIQSDSIKGLAKLQTYRPY